MGLKLLICFIQGRVPGNLMQCGVEMGLSKT